MINFHSWYAVGSEKFFNKFAALLHAKGDLDKVKLHFNENYWDNINWQEEPNEDWETLCGNYVKELRDQYNYVALWYTGGYDSNTILKTFIKNNILLDEIVIFDKNDVFVDTGILHAIKTAYYVKEKIYPNLNVNVIKWQIDDLAKWYKKYADNWIYEHIGNHTRLSKNTLHYTRNVYDHSVSTLKKLDNRCDISGHEKCKVFLNNDNWYVFFPDTELSNHIGSYHKCFFYNKKIFLKQVYNTISWFESLPELTSELIHLIQGKDQTIDGVFTKYYSQWNIAMGRYPLDEIDIESTRGYQKFFYTDDHNSPDSKKVLTYYEKNDKQIYKIYMNGLAELNKNFGRYNNSFNSTIIGKPYFVRQANLRQHIHK